MNSIGLGDEIKDAVTGMQGICTGIAQHISGCETIAIQPQGMNKDGQPFEVQWFDRNRIAVVAAGKVTLKPVEEAEPLRNVGGPQDAPGESRSHPRLGGQNR